ncbi:hypothetical protein J6590_094500 [Homalodisca vitripennis]|nr:hypothetical protein J6590_094500 [Homalodisca vitripennis]
MNTVYSVAVASPLTTESRNVISRKCEPQTKCSPSLVKEGYQPHHQPTSENRDFEICETPIKDATQKVCSRTKLLVGPIWNLTPRYENDQYQTTHFHPSNTVHLLRNKSPSPFNIFFKVIKVSSKRNPMRVNGSRKGLSPTGCSTPHNVSSPPPSYIYPQSVAILSAATSGQTPSTERNPSQSNPQQQSQHSSVPTTPSLMLYQASLIRAHRIGGVITREVRNGENARQTMDLVVYRMTSRKKVTVQLKFVNLNINSPLCSILLRQQPNGRDSLNSVLFA